MLQKSPLVEEPFLEEVVGLDVALLARFECLSSCETTWTWDWDDRVPKFTIQVIGFDGFIQLRSEEGEIRAEIPVEYTACHFGGERPWFRCPDADCGVRVRRVHCFPPHGRWGCRRCLQLTYASPCERETARAARRARKIKQQLGGSRNLMEPLPPRLWGTHHKSYNDAVARYEEALTEFGQRSLRAIARIRM
jgi:hypothetical protein